MEKEIIEYLEKNRKPISLERLGRVLKLNKSEKRKLKGLVRYLEKQGLLKLKGDLVLPLPRNKVIRGIISLNKRGFAFVTPETAEGGLEDIFIPPGQTAGQCPLGSWGRKAKKTCGLWHRCCYRS